MSRRLSRWASKYLMLRARLHGWVCRKAILTKEDHDHTWLKFRMHGHWHSISARYHYDDDE